ncbi:unnamed protein product [Vicia faba]|uniref:Uncharacterized protein n=1 Tax=Vicia faba TaxID=3906 RepID=A0AAV1ARH0_VICFA|nr:unnamed protein product [Vicia faba]
MDDSNQDSYDLFPELSLISISQQHLLQSTPFVGDTLPNNTPSEIDAGIIPVSSPPDTNQDVFHTPPEDNIDVPHCAVNQTIDVDHESQVFVDLAGVSELGFPENSQRVDGGGLVDEFRVLERGISELGQVPEIKLKLGFHSLGNFNAVGCEQVNVDAAKNDDLNREILVAENSVSENVEMQNAEVVEGSGLLPMPESELESGKDKGKQKISVFDVLKVLSDSNKDEDEDHDSDGLTVLEAAKLAGITFPRPSWWPDHYACKLFNFDDDDQVRP